MDRFEYCLGVTLGFEGGLSNHAADRGGLTNFGVTQMSYDKYRTNKNLPKQSVTKMAQEEAFDLYRSGYWVPINGDKLGSPVDMVMFDTCVNSGPSRANKLLQRALGVNDDGVFGPGSWKAYSAFGDKADLARKCLDAREDFYHEIVAHDASQLVFINGWINRVNKLRKIAGTL